MDASLHALPVELPSTWSDWRAAKQEAPLTPPLSNVFARRVLPPQTQAKTVLPSISHFDYASARMSPGESRPMHMFCKPVLSRHK